MHFFAEDLILLISSLLNDLQSTQSFARRLRARADLRLLSDVDVDGISIREAMS